MASLVCEDGKRWGERAADFQMGDARAILGEGRPNWHFETRPRGGSKTTDIAALIIAWLVGKAKPYDRGYVIATNTTTASLVIDAAAAFISQTPELEGLVYAENERVVSTTGAWVQVMPLSESGSWGRLNTHLLICDEFAQWPDTRGARRVWQAVRTTTQKTPGCRLVILTSAGEPGHWSYTEVFKAARREIERAKEQNRDPFWRISETPGPVPWQDPEELAQLENELPPSRFAQLILNQWTEDESRLVAPDDLAAARVLPDVLEPKQDRQYVIGVDLGIKVDPSVVAVCHGEPVYVDDDGHRTLLGTRVFLDKMLVFQPSKRNPVDPRDVQKAVKREARRYRAHVVVDPWNTEPMVRDLVDAGIMCSQYPFTGASIAKLAFNLSQQFRKQLISIPRDDEALAHELSMVELRETNVPGQRRMDHEPGKHDDRAIALALATTWILSRPEWSFDGLYEPSPVASTGEMLDPWAECYKPDTDAQGSDPFAVLHPKRSDNAAPVARSRSYAVRDGKMEVVGG